MPSDFLCCINLYGTIEICLQCLVFYFLFNTYTTYISSHLISFKLPDSTPYNILILFHLNDPILFYSIFN